MENHDLHVYINTHHTRTEYVFLCISLQHAVMHVCTCVFVYTQLFNVQYY